jgi:hypothetical protein
MFRLIEASFGVKNVELFLDRLRYKPAAISHESEGYGSYDILRNILDKKRIPLFGSRQSTFNTGKYLSR